MSLITTTLNAQSQLPLPAEIRRQLGIQPGDRLIVETEDDCIIIRKAPPSDVDALAAYQSDLWRGYAEQLAQARDEWDR